MNRSGGGVYRAHLRARRARESARHDEGFAIVDVLVASLLLLIIMLPIAYLLASTQNTLSSYQSDSTAELLASQWLNNVKQQAIATPTNWPPTTSSINSPVGYASCTSSGCATAGVYSAGSTIASSWPTADTSGHAAIASGGPTVPSCAGTAYFPLCQYVGQRLFKVTVAGGWCFEGTSSPINWGNYAAQSPPKPATYMLAVNVTYTSRVGASVAVTEYTTVPTQSGWTAPTSVTNTAQSCPTVLNPSTPT